METRSEILEELKQWQSPLADAPRNMPFEVPGNYFSELADNIVAGLQEEKTPLQWNDTTPFAVPEGYFTSLPQNILAKAKEADQPKNKKKLIAFPTLIRAAAAVLVIALGIAGYQYFNKEDLTTQQQLAAVSDEDINAYVEQHIDEFDTDMLASSLSSADLSELENIGNDEIINYLNETGWDTTENYN